jgi:hypothetical protein
MNTPKITTLEELRTLSQGSPLELIIESLISRNFVPSNHEPLTEKDTPIGTLSQVEKAIHDAEISLSNLKPEFTKKLSEIGQEIEVIDHRGGDAMALKEKMEKLRKEVKYASEVSRNLIELYWSFIRQRLYNEGFSDLNHLGIRAGDTLVIPEKKANEESRRILRIRIGV